MKLDLYTFMGHRRRLFTMELTFSFLVLLTLLTTTVMAATTVEPSSEQTEAPPGDSVLSCSEEENICRNGQCQKNEADSSVSCVCDSHTYGDLCQHVDTRSLGFYIDDNYIEFYWTNTPTLDNYHTTHYRPHTDISTIVLYIDPLVIDGKKALVGDLEPDEKDNIVCIVANETITGKSQEELVQDVLTLDHRYCVNVICEYDGLGPYGMAAMGTAIAMSSVVFILMFWKAVVNCMERDVREKMISEVLGKFDILPDILPDILRRGSSKKRTSTAADENT